METEMSVPNVHNIPSLGIEESIPILIILFF